MWAWVHIGSPVTIFFFLVHVLDMAVIRINAEEYDARSSTPTRRRSSAFMDRPRLLRALPRLQRRPRDPHRLLVPGPRYQRQMLWVVVGLFIIVFGAAAIRLLQLILTHAFH